MPYDMNLDELMELLINGSVEQIDEIIEDFHPADILDILKAYPDLRLQILTKLPEAMVASIIDEADDEEKYDLLELLPEDMKREIVGEMSSDELADMIGHVTPEEADEIFESMEEEDAEEVRELLTYDPETAGGIMATEFIAIRENMTVDETFNYLRKEAPEAENAYYLFVLDNNDILKGVVSLRDLVISDLSISIGEIMNEHVISVPVSMDQEEVGHIFEKYGFLTMPVVNEGDEMLGIITVDDIMDILRDETTEDIYRLAGIQEDEKLTSTVWSSVKRRLPWLFVNLFTAMLASATVSLFEETIGKAVLLATFMPIVAGMGGNTGTQTLTIIVRGIALGEIDLKNSKKILLKEIGVGLSTGVSIGLAVAAIGSLWAGKPIFGLVIGLSMLLNMTAATLAGFLVPIALKKLNIDPALASAVFVTTVTDVLGFFFFLGLGTMFISYLI